MKQIKSLATPRVYYRVTVLLLTLVLLCSYLPALRPWTHWLTPPVALSIGLLFALLFGQPCATFNKKMSKWLLQASVVGLGFGMNLYAALESGKEGMSFTVVSVVGTLFLGWLIGYKWLKVNKRTSYLIGAGTAICGGSAIAAVGPIVGAKDSEMTVALGTVFLLNAVALLVFPTIGFWTGMDQHAFGTWAAIAIHDTSSVVGAGAAYGTKALEVATTVKLTRALWIIPMALLTSMIWKAKGKSITVPLFIVGFVLAMIANTWFLGSCPEVGTFIASLSKKMLTLTLFFIGASLSLQVLKEVGLKPLLQGVLLWVVISVTTWAYIAWTM